MSSELVKLCLDSYNGKVKDFSQGDSGEVIRKAFVDIIGTDKINYRVFRRNQAQIYEIIEDVLDQLIVDGWKNNKFFERFVETKDLDFGDRNEFYVEDKSLLTVSKFSGNHWDIRRQKLDIGETFSVNTSMYGVKIYTDFARFIAGRIDWVNFINKVKISFENKINGEVYTSFMNASNYLPAEFKETGTFSENKMLEICGHVSASCGNTPITIIGTRTGLNKMTGTISTDWVSEDMKNAKNLQGMVSHWNGIQCMPIQNVHKANTFDFELDDNKLLIVPTNTKPIKLVNEGDSLIKEVSDGKTNMDMSLEYEYQKKMGIGVIFNTMYGAFTMEK